MNKELIQDIKQPKKRLADILPSGASRERAGPNLPAASAGAGSGRGRRALWGLVILLIVGLPLAYFVSQMFARATIRITPKKAELTVDETVPLVALPTDDEALLKTGVGYQTMTIQLTDQLSVPAAEKKEVAERASGQIVVVNRYSDRPQTLVANTRFAAADGRIYRIKDRVAVPSYTSAGGVITPGELKVTVYADKPGEEYNGEVGDLTIPGFKGGPQFDKLTARGVTAMTGGFVGERLVLEPAARATAEKELAERLRSALDAEARTSLPEGFFTFPEAQFYKFQSRTKSGGQISGGLTLELDGELTALIFSLAEVSRYLAKARLVDYDGAAVVIENFDDLELSLIAAADFDPRLNQPVKLNLVGPARLRWQFDSAALKQALAGVAKKDYQAVFLEFSGIARAEASFRPPWLKRFPSDPVRIIVVFDL